MIGQITRRVLHYADTQAGILQRLPKGSAGFAFVFYFGNGIPVDSLEGDVAHNLLFVRQGKLIWRQLHTTLGSRPHEPEQITTSANKKIAGIKPAIPLIYLNLSSVDVVC
jgi:hypothetical protein